jgi:hypothetical protein
VIAFTMPLVAFVQKVIVLSGFGFYYQTALFNAWWRWRLQRDPSFRITGNWPIKDGPYFSRDLPDECRRLRNRLGLATMAFVALLIAFAALQQVND